MSIDDITDRGGPEPRGNLRQPMSQASQAPRIRPDTNAIVIGLSLTICVVAFLITSSGWSF